jgi:hypothetical protein
MPMPVKTMEDKNESAMLECYNMNVGDFTGYKDHEWREEKKCMGLICVKLIPYVADALDSHGCFNLDKESLSWVVDKVLDKAKHECKEVQEILLEAEKAAGWCKRKLLTALVESLTVLCYHKKLTGQDNLHAYNDNWPVPYL